MHRGTWLAVVVASMVLAACGTPAESAPESPSRVVPIAGTNLSKIELTPKAIERISLQTAPVQGPAAGAGGTGSVPLAAVLYLSDGSTWVYTVVGTRTYERQRVTIARASGDTAILQAGPAPGTLVVTTGVAELLGSEYGVAGGQ